MNLHFDEVRTHPTLRAGVQFSDWDRPAVNGNSVGMFLWVYDESGPVQLQEIYLRNDAQCIARVSALQRTEGVLAYLCPGHEANAAFGHTCINRLILREGGVIAVLVTDMAGDRHHVGNIHYSANNTDELVPKVDLGLRPILITSLGRSGSTVLANSLGLHPKVLAIGGYPYEYRFYTYCLQAMYVVTSPANLNHSMGGDAFETRHQFNIGFNPFNHREYDRLVGGDHLRDFYEQRFASDAPRFFMEQARGALAAHAKSKPGAVAFVEKMAGTHLANLAERTCEGVREIVLVRDFWQLVLSMVAFDAKRGTSGFFSAKNQQQADYWLGAIAFQHCHTAGRARLPGRIAVSYEELMRDPRSALAILMKRLGIPTDPAALDAMMQAFGDNPYSESHSTQAEKQAIDLEALFSKRARDAINELLARTGVEIPEDPDRDFPATWEADRADQADGDAAVQMAKWSEALSMAVEKEREELRSALAAQREGRQRDRTRSERDVTALTERAARAEASNQRLLDELTRMRREVAVDRHAREKEREDVARRAREAETYNRALLDGHKREMDDAVKQIAELKEHAETARKYTVSLEEEGAAARADIDRRDADFRITLAERDREIAELGKQVGDFQFVVTQRDGEIAELRKQVGDFQFVVTQRDGELASVREELRALSGRAERAEAYARSLDEERARTLADFDKREADFKFIVGEREREIEGYKKELAAHEDRARRAEEYAKSLRSELERRSIEVAGLRRTQ